MFTLKIKRALSPLEKFLFFELAWMIVKYARVRRTRENFKSISWISRKTVESFINKLKIVRSEHSFAGEFAALDSALKRLDIQGGYLVDIGAADGVRQSSTLGFLVGNGWSGSLFEYNPDSFARLSFLYNDKDGINLGKLKITPLNIAKILESYTVPKKFEFLNIDIDSYDLSVLREIIDSGFRPKLISMEVNEKFPPNIYFEVLYSPDHSWEGDHFFGCSLSAAYESLAPRGYELQNLEYNNAIFIDNQSELQEEVDLRATYEQGYKGKVDRIKLFPWNQNIEILQTLNSIESEKYLNTLFSKYKGKYRLERRPLND